MTIGVLIISHESLGQTLLDICTKTLGLCPLTAQVIGVPLDADPDVLINEAETRLDTLDTGDGVLVLTDLCGATPANIACKLRHRIKQHKQLTVVAGLNLPMLMRVLNYPDLSLDDSAERAIKGGQQGVMLLSGRHER
ncbi:MAG: PTS sugar transporter subunit IIA [Ectothiorhodospiraceae bacterium]|nr:PTS sugar transporter subunit IIA [Ectothiorhodospiraceae bacterium]